MAIRTGGLDHVHLWVDGKGPQPMPGKSSTDLKLAAGSHTVKVVGATKQHKEVGPSDSVTFTVK